MVYHNPGRLKDMVVKHANFLRLVHCLGELHYLSGSALVRLKPHILTRLHSDNMYLPTSPIELGSA